MFGAPGEVDDHGFRMPTEEEIVLSMHWSDPRREDGCPALKHRWWRWSHNRSPWAKVERHWASYAWRHRGTLIAKAYLWRNQRRIDRAVARRQRKEQAA